MLEIINRVNEIPGCSYCIVQSVIFYLISIHRSLSYYSINNSCYLTDPYTDATRGIRMQSKRCERLTCT